MTPFLAPLDDILFTLDHVAAVRDLPDWDAEMNPEILGHFASFAEGVIAPLDEVGDTEGARLENGCVYMPTGFREAFAQLAEGGWQGLTAPEAFGGMAAHPMVAACVSEIFSGANHAMQMVCNLVPGAIETLRHHGTEDQKAKWIPALASGEALSTMCLTEPGAGSELARLRTRAVREGDAWAITGEKIFISGGDQDLSDTIMHLVLARSGATEDGAKGLSLFLCDKRMAGNRISVTRIEEKLGLHASPTCQMAFDAAPAELIGEEGQGLRAMFTMMNHARIDVALQGVAHASRAHQIAAAYAADRVQGRGADGLPVSIDRHPDVRRMLDEQRALAMGARAMCHVTLRQMCSGGDPALIEFLTSLCKMFATNAGTQSADLGIQVLGGYGYLNEYRVAQTWRDARITQIYEGTNGIHALTLATRGVRGSGAARFADLVARLAGGEAELTELVARFREMAERLSGPAASEGAHEFASFAADLLFRALWVHMARAARGLPQEDELARLCARVTARPLPLRVPEPA